VLYAAKLMTGTSAGVHAPALPEADVLESEDEQAAATSASGIASASATDRRNQRRDMDRSFR
jgi:hypothetical protein